MDEAVVIEEQPETLAETLPKERRQRGRPAGVGSTPKLAMDVAGPRYKTYNSDAPNRNQRTSIAWAWWNALPQPAREIIDLTIYRDWPITLDPTEDSDAKSIEKILGTEPIQTDQDFVDRFGAGDYRAYLNVNPKNEPRRTLFTAYVKCTHDFRDFPPTDRRIDNVANVDLSDKSNGSYVAWLRATGKLKDGAQQENEMATATAGLTDVLGKALDRGDRLMEKLIEERTAPEPAIPPDPPPSAEEKLNESLTLLERLSNFTKGSPTADPLAMMSAVIEAAKVLNQSNSPQALTPFMDRIASLEEKLRATEAEMLRGQLTEIKDQLRALKETPPPSNVLLPDGSNLDSIIQRAVEKLMDKPEDNPWIDIVKQAMPVALPLLGGIVQRMMMPPTAAAPASNFPMPPQNFQPGVTQPQAQLPAPTPQPQPVAQPQAAGAFTTGNPQLDYLLMAITVPLADALRDGDSGDMFAEYFITEYGFDIHTQLASSGTDAVVGVLYSYPPLASTLKPLARERVTKFVDEFVKFTPTSEPATQPA